MIDKEGAIRESELMVELGSESMDSYQNIKQAIASLEQKGKIICSLHYGSKVASTTFQTH
jgi:hypothetical protein